MKATLIIAGLFIGSLLVSCGGKDCPDGLKECKVDGTTICAPEGSC